MQATLDDVQRRFFASLLGGELRKDGSLPGFAEALRKWSEHKVALAQHYAWAAWRKITRDGREPDECIAAAVVAFEQRIALEDQPTTQSRPEYAAFRMALIQRILDERLLPRQVAIILEGRAEHYPEISYDEVLSLRRMGDEWKSLDAPPTQPQG